MTIRPWQALPLLDMVALVEVGEGGGALLVGNGLLEQHRVDDRNAVGAA